MSWIKVFARACLEAFLEGFGRFFTRGPSPALREKKPPRGDREGGKEIKPPTDETRMPDTVPDRGHRRMMAGRH